MTVDEATLYTEFLTGSLLHNESLVPTIEARDELIYMNLMCPDEMGGYLNFDQYGSVTCLLRHDHNDLMVDSGEHGLIALPAGKYHSR